MAKTQISGGRFRRRNYGKNHGYLLDGQKILSVTKVLSLGLPKPALINWAAWEAASYAVDHHRTLFAAGDFNAEAVKRDISAAPTRRRNTAAVKGTQIHTFAERLVRGEKVEGIPDEIGAKVDQYVRFLNEWEVEEIAVERPICILDVPLGGTFDVIFRSPKFPGRVFLADVKTAKGVYGENALQLEAYGRADFYLDENGDEQSMAALGITDHVVIHLEDDRYTVVQMHRGDEVWAVFVAGVEIARAMDGPRGETELDSFVLGELYRPGEGWL